MIASKKVLKFVLGLKLRQLRLKNRLSLKELAEKSGLSASYLNEIEKGKKYPKVEKLVGLANVLDVSLEYLVSVKMGKSLHPLIKFLESDLFKNLPLDIFGISGQDVYDLMSHAPEKFSSFLVTILEMARSYDIKPDDLYSSALRAYQEMSDNYFPEIEKESADFVEKFGLKGVRNDRFTIFRKILEDEYNYQIDEKILSVKTETKTIRSLVKVGIENKLLINEKLSSRQKEFVLGKELAACWLKINRKNPTSMNAAVSFEDVLNDYKISYFSGALILDREHLVEDLKIIFSRPKFSEHDFIELLERYDVSIEVFMHRLTQILPKFFKLNQLFFLRFTNDMKNLKDRFFISKELHLSQLHNPHGVSLHEHYCRRWITVSLLRNLAENIENSKGEMPIIGAQKSIMSENGSQYFCVSIARKSRLKEGANICLTIGILMDEHFRKTVNFVDDPEVPTKLVNQTCERCNISDCEVRAADPLIYNKIRSGDHRRAAILDLMKRL